ncbi:hypothetical protein V8C42DRAFT_333731 [Trichoderma barbatum]
MSPLFSFLGIFSRCYEYVPVVRLGVGLGGVLHGHAFSWMVRLEATSPHARLCP